MSITYVLRDEITYRWPVKVREPSATTPGKFDEQTFVAIFKALPRDEARALDEEVMAALKEGDETKQDLLLERVVLGWNDVIDEKKQPIAFSAATLRAALRWPWVRLAFYEAWTNSQAGEARRLGN